LQRIHLQITPVAKTVRATMWDNISTAMKQEAEQMSHYREKADNAMSDTNEDENWNYDAHQDEEDWSKNNSGKKSNNKMPMTSTTPGPTLMNTTPQLETLRESRLLTS
jgi:hypothetical protein